MQYARMFGIEKSLLPRRPERTLIVFCSSMSIDILRTAIGAGFTAFTRIFRPSKRLYGVVQAVAHHSGTGLLGSVRHSADERDEGHDETG